MNVIGLLEVPLAMRVPCTCKALSLSNLTVTPGSIVRVAPVPTRTLPVTTNGLSATAQVSSDEIMPDTEVPAESTSVAKTIGIKAADNKANQNVSFLNSMLRINLSMKEHPIKSFS